MASTDRPIELSGVEALSGLEARMTAEARATVLENGDWLTEAQIAGMAGFSANDHSVQPNKWKNDGQIFTVCHRGVEYFPGYALDPLRDYRPVEGLTRVLDVFRGKKDGWGLAFWFASVNGFLGGKRRIPPLRAALFDERERCRS